MGSRARQIDDAAAEAEVVVASGSVPPGVPNDFFARVARCAKQHGAQCVIDTSGRCTGSSEGRGHADQAEPGGLSDLLEYATRQRRVHGWRRAAS